MEVLWAQQGGDRFQRRERVDERWCPWPVGVQAQSGPPSLTDEPGSEVQEPVPQSLRFGVGERGVETGQFHSGEEVLGDQGELAQGLVGLEGVMGEIGQAGVLAGAYAVLDTGAAAVAELERAMSWPAWSVRKHVWR